MQVIKMSVGNQNQIDRGQVADHQTRPTQALEDEEPGSKIGVNQNVLAANLDKEACMANKGDRQFAVSGEDRLVTFSRARGDGGVPNQTSKLPRSSPESETQH